MIGERIKQLRLQRGLTMTELAERAGIAKSYISSIERNLQTNPSIDCLTKLSGVLRVPVSALVQENAEEEVLLDAAWTELLREAMDSGVSTEEFRQFLEFNKWKKQNVTA
ncbi:helix-turn-helix domain-containing protein [Ectobacillus ponti]|uniref:Helix-turn-helix domain-containing protein n=1 Tax=Ectobacillus ponti TaxID=2961894 RepID=A0AA41X643_9BACI|nr:helix-turn-helix domain-containing protein [Ectobacillus ponti]MCP8967878.1 helix-turn-helix domain-containing protein [Ectobacillus ponti]